MKTQAEIVAQRKLSSKTCSGCIHSGPGFKKGEPVLKCCLTGKIVPPTMTGCFLWATTNGRRKY